MIRGVVGMWKWVSVSVLVFFLMAITHNVSAKEGDSSMEMFVGFVEIGPTQVGISIVELAGRGIGVGLGYGEFEKFDNLQLRVDVSIFNFQTTTEIIDESMDNISIFLGGRYSFLATQNIRPFIEGGLSVNFLKSESNISLDTSLGSFSASASERETKIGVVPGIGVQFMATPDASIGIGFRYHLISKGVGRFDTDPSFGSWVVIIAHHF